MNKKQEYSDDLMKLFYEDKKTVSEIAKLKDKSYNTIFQQVKRLSLNYLKKQNETK